MVASAWDTSDPEIRKRDTAVNFRNGDTPVTGEPPSRVLLLMRHGKAESAHTSDVDRPLTPKGHKQSVVVGRYLREQSLIPSTVLVSSARRTRETWDSLRRELGKEAPEASCLDELYLGGTQEVRRALAQVDAREKIVLVIAHEPTMSQLAAALANDETSETSALAQVRIGVPTGSMSVLTSTRGSWGELSDESLVLHTLVRG